MQTAPCPKCGQLAAIDSFCPDDGTRIVVTGYPNPNAAPARITLGKGTKVGEYVIEDFLGKGGFGEVWSAQHPAIGKQVAVKFLSASSLINYEMLARFKREARAVNEIGHENLVDIFSFGELPDGRPYYVMELLRGESLAEYVAKKGPPPFALLLEVFRQVCEALQAAHQAKVIHRDLKPDNIFLDKKKSPALSVKLLDFGIAKLATNDEESENLTRTGIPFGTPSYMSPEQCDGAKNVDHRSDIYALGIVLYELLTGKNPFREPGDSALDLLMKHKKETPPAPSSAAPDRGIPREVDELVLKAIAKKPAERFDSAMELFEQLKRYLPKQGGVAPQAQASYAPTLPPNTKELAARPSRRWRSIALGFVATSVSAALVFLLLPKEPARVVPAPPQSQSMPSSAPTISWKPRPRLSPTAEKAVVASSVKASEGALYSEGNARDGNPATSWCEGVAGDGVGEWIAFLPGQELSVPMILRVTPGQPKLKDKNTKTPYPTLLIVELLDAEKTLNRREVVCENAPCETRLAPITGGAAVSIRLTVKATNPDAKNKDTCLAEISLSPN